MSDAFALADEIFGRGPLAGRVERDRPLGALTTYRVGGPAARFVTVETMEDLHAVGEAVRAGALAVVVLGRGSNLLVADRGFAGLAVQLGPGFAVVDIDGTLVRAGGAASLPVVARRTASAGLTGFEWAVGVPGSIGGAVRMNAGGHGSDLAASLVDATVVDLAGHGGPRTVTAGDLRLSYRCSALRDDQVVVSATVRLAHGDAAAALGAIEDIVKWRREHQPGGQNAGSVFKNPPDDSAGRLIDAAGCRGLRLRSASVSAKHANFFQADERGSADDIRELMMEVQRRVRDAHGVHLVPETRMIGFTDDGDHGAEAVARAG